MGSIKLKGMVDVTEALSKGEAALEDVKTVVKYHGAGLQQKAKQYCPVDTGNLKRSIGLELEDFGMTASCEATAEYAPYVEYGTRYMDAQPFMRLAMYNEEPEFIADLKKLMGD